MIIRAIKKNGLGAKIGLQVGDDLIKINQHPIGDLIDYRFYASDPILHLEVRRNGLTLNFEVELSPTATLGLEFDEFKYRTCANKCIFCFIDQNPPGLRPSLYFKDEDYRLSFLYGNYVTLTNVQQADLDRIVAQRLSPLYVSVHATEWEVRRVLLGINKPDHLLEKLRYLAEHRIEIHAQVVLCPGINDREQLEKTIFDLSELFPAVQSVVVVPVGLTKHRAHLPLLKPVGIEDARLVLYQIGKLQQIFRARFSSHFVYPADEFFLQTGQPIPSADYYDGYPQIEDGVGMVRLLLENLPKVRRRLPKKLPRPTKITLVTGMLAGDLLERAVIPLLQPIENLEVQLVRVPNRFFGKQVTVVGLLTGQDIWAALKTEEENNPVLLPKKCLNYDGLFLDDWTVADLAAKLQRPIVLVDDYFSNLPKILKTDL